MRRARVVMTGLVGLVGLGGLVVCWAAAQAPYAAQGPAQGAAQGEASLFAEGNRHYAASEFEEAAKDYRQLLNQGFSSEAIHYNLGNALFKMGEIGPAILEFEKAAAIAPNDPDLIANLEYVRTLTADKTTEAGAQTTAFFIERLLSLTTIDQDAAIFCTLYVLMGAMVAVRIAASGTMPKRLAVWGMATLALPLALATGSYGVKLYRSATTTHAIVLQERLDVRSGPGDENTTLFTIHEGLKLRVRKQQGSWFQVSLDNGLNGWVPASSLGII